MNDYMRALHQRFFREPDVSELEEDIENTRQEVRDCLDKMQRRSGGRSDTAVGCPAFRVS